MNYLSLLGLGLAVASLLCLLVSGPGYRLGLWQFSAGIALVKAAGYISATASVVCLAGFVVWQTELFPQGLVPAIVGFVIASGVLGLTLKWKHNLASVPYIHDITTDTEHPPLFVAVLPLRAGADNSAAYGGPDIAEQQKKGYPDLKPGFVSRPPVAAFPEALQAAIEMGWKIVASEPASLRIEATDTTPWFGFKDDVVIRLSPTPTGSRIDVRSVSRVGKSDVGTNARRITAYLTRLK
jgi:uncharacterized protein (DUF1499 family)